MEDSYIEMQRSLYNSGIIGYFGVSGAAARTGNLQKNRENTILEKAKD